MTKIKVFPVHLVNMSNAADTLTDRQHSRLSVFSYIVFILSYYKSTSVNFAHVWKVFFIFSDITFHYFLHNMCIHKHVYICVKLHNNVILHIITFLLLVF